jgi:hypothetical protein
LVGAVEVVGNQGLDEGNLGRHDRDRRDLEEDNLGHRDLGHHVLEGMDEDEGHHDPGRNQDDPNLGRRDLGRDHHHGRHHGRKLQHHQTSSQLRLGSFQILGCKQILLIDNHQNHLREQCVQTRKVRSGIA